MSVPLAKKILLIGWDAADWKIINPLLDAGQMPALEGLINQGVMGNLASFRPILSPLIWNSIATGKRPEKHGILDFVEPDPDTGGIRPISSTSRKVKAIWNILTQRRFRTHVVGWFAGHPAEPIHGVAVSPLYPLPHSATPSEWPLARDSVHPKELADTFADLRVHPADIVGDELQMFIPRLAEIDQSKDNAPEGAADLLAECCSIHNAATWILEHREWDFLAVFYNVIDHFCHRFMPYYPPRLDGIPERDFELYQGVVPAAYRFQDLLLRRLLELAGPDATVIIVSDHGFQSDDLRPRHIPKEPAGNTAWHRPVGIICMKGPGIRKDERIYGATVLDITPTLLALLGLPIGQDMDGRLMTQALETPLQPEMIPSWEEEPGECGMHPADMRTDPLAAQAVMNQLVALGYLDPLDPDKAKATEMVLREHKYNLGRVYLESLRPGEALPLFEELAAKYPDEMRFGLELARCYLGLGRREEAKALLLPLSEKGSQPWADWLLGVAYSEQGDNELAVNHLQRAEQSTPRLPDLHLRLGDIYRAMMRWGDAQRSYEKALKLDPDSAPGHLGLAMVSLAERRNREAAEQALIAVGLQHYLPMGHYFLGVALARLRRFERAALAFETTLTIAPDFLKAHRWLVTVYSQPGGDLEKAAQHRRRAEEIRRARRAKSVP